VFYANVHEHAGSVLYANVYEHTGSVLYANVYEHAGSVFYANVHEHAGSVLYANVYEHTGSVLYVSRPVRFFPVRNSESGDESPQSKSESVLALRRTQRGDRPFSIDPQAAFWQEVARPVVPARRASQGRGREASRRVFGE
jgi:hypothetical protein